MGKEAVCTVQWMKETGEGKASLEMPFLLFRGPFRLKLRVEGAHIDVQDGVLAVPAEGGTARFHLGAQAEKWAGAIRNPKGRLDKMGLKAGMRVQIAGDPPGDFLDELAAARVTTVRARPDHAVLFVEKKTALRKLASVTPPVWIVYPKGIAAITEGDVLEAGRAAGLKDVKVCSFSATHTALRFTPPLASPRR